MRENFQKMIDLLTEAEEDMIKFDEKGNKAAGTRVRGVMQEIKKLAQEVRVAIQERKNEAKAE